MKLNNFNTFSFKDWVIKHKNLKELNNSLSLLSPTEKYIFEHFIFFDNNFSEIAINLGIPTNKIIDTYNTIVNKIKNFLIFTAYK